MCRTTIVACKMNVLAVHRPWGPSFCIPDNSMYSAGAVVFSPLAPHFMPVWLESHTPKVEQKKTEGR